MSKFEPLWKYIKDTNVEEGIISFEEIEKILSFPIDHSFLTFKKELIEFGYEIGKISMKNKTVSFKKLKSI